MNKNIFCGKALDDGKWVEGYLGSEHTIIVTSPMGHTDEIIVDPESVGQYVGVVDKFRNKIFEGDIVKTKYGRLCLVSYIVPLVRYELVPIAIRENMKYKEPDKFDLWYYPNLEIIGKYIDIQPYKGHEEECAYV